MILLCPSDRESGEAPTDPKKLLDDQSCFYFGYVLTSDSEVRAFADAYRKRAAQGQRFNEDLKVAPGTGTCGTDTLYLMREGVERDLAQDQSNRGEAMIAQGTIPVMMDRLEHHIPGGCNVLFMDGHVEFIKYPGKFPVTQETMKTLESLHAMARTAGGDSTAE